MTRPSHIAARELNSDDKFPFWPSGPKHRLLAHDRRHDRVMEEDARGHISSIPGGTLVLRSAEEVPYDP